MRLIQEEHIDCPWCGEAFSISIDTSCGSHEYIEDCTVCCRPILISVECEPGSISSVDPQRP
jgi:hypothetical protein